MNILWKKGLASTPILLQLPGDNTEITDTNLVSVVRYRWPWWWQWASNKETLFSLQTVDFSLFSLTITLTCILVKLTGWLINGIWCWYKSQIITWKCIHLMSCLFVNIYEQSKKIYIYILTKSNRFMNKHIHKHGGERFVRLWQPSFRSKGGKRNQIVISWAWIINICSFWISTIGEVKRSLRIWENLAFKGLFTIFFYVFVLKES